MHNYLLLVRGVPGVGKTTFAHSLFQGSPNNIILDREFEIVPFSIQEKQF